MGSKLAAYRNEIARLHAENDELREIIRFLKGQIEDMRATHAEEMARLRAELAALSPESDGAAPEEVERLKSELAQVKKELEGRTGQLRRYENSTTPGRHGYNEDRAKTRAEEQRMLAEETGDAIPENHKIGPPDGHPGARNQPQWNDVVEHHTERCPRCGNTHLKLRGLHGKTIIDFEGDSRWMCVTLHRGHAVRCDICRRTFKPRFPSIKGTAFGIGVLGHILEYAGKKNTDGDIAYYMKNLHRHSCADSTVWNARRALADLLEPVVRRIIDEMKRAPYLMIDETPYPYRKGTAYVWVVRTDTASLVVPAAGRAGANAPAFLEGLRHMPVVVDGYVVYYNMFDVIQRCWAHILLKAEEVYIRCKDPARKATYMKLYHRLCNMHRRAKGIAGATLHCGGADARTCLDLEREVGGIAAAYGDTDFATHLNNALPNLFTFLRHPGMPSTNNDTERDIRDAVVVQRRFRHKFARPEGMRVFSILMSFHSTCRKLGVVPRIMFERMVESPGFDMVSYGLSALNPPALPAPPSTGGVEHGSDREEIPAGLPAGPDIRSGRGTESAPPGRPHRIPATIIILAAFIQPACPDWTGQSAHAKTPAAIPAMDIVHVPVDNRTTAPCGRPPPAIAS